MKQNFFVIVVSILHVFFKHQMMFPNMTCKYIKCCTVHTFLISYVRSIMYPNLQ